MSFQKNFYFRSSTMFSALSEILWAPPANISQGVNYDPMNPMGDGMRDSEDKDAKAALRATSLVTK